MAQSSALSAAARELGRKGGRVRNPFKGFGSSGKAAEAARRRWELYRLRKAKKA